MSEYTNLSDRELLAQINQLVKKGRQYEAKNDYYQALSATKRPINSGNLSIM